MMFRWIRKKITANDDANRPPSTLDNGRVRRWAWSGSRPFGVIRYTDETVAHEVYGLAVCELGGDFYLFYCDSNWEVVQDMDHASEQEASDSVSPGFGNVRVVWRDYDC